MDKLGFAGFTKQLRGGFMKAKIIDISSVFPATINEIWDKLQSLKTLQFIAAPYATFEPYDKNIL